jgi:hypothetical protein
VSSLLVSAASSAADFCFVIARSLLRPNVPLSGGKDKPVAIA